eukprot:626476-Amphidinium_carterae.1
MMSAVEIFAIMTNSFEGALPESGLQAMRSMLVLYVYLNRFAGTLPSRAMAGIRSLLVSHNHFEGKVSQTQCGHLLV